MSARIRFAFVLLLVCLCGASSATPPRSEFEEGSPGRERTPQSTEVEHYPMSNRCRDIGWEVLPDQQPPEDLMFHSYSCDGQIFMQLEQHFGEHRFRVLDALLMPRLKPGERQLRQGLCELRGRADIDLFVIVHLGTRNKVDWKTGVRAAWWVNRETRRFEPLSASQPIICWRPTPP